MIIIITVIWSRSVYSSVYTKKFPLHRVLHLRKSEFAQVRIYESGYTVTYILIIAVKCRSSPINCCCRSIIRQEHRAVWTLPKVFKFTVTISRRRSEKYRRVMVFLPIGIPCLLRIYICNIYILIPYYKNIPYYIIKIPLYIYT